MNESEYIQATNLARLTVLSGVLRDIMPGGVIPEGELAMVHKMVSRWQAAGFAAVEAYPEVPTFPNTNNWPPYAPSREKEAP